MGTNWKLKEALEKRRMQQRDLAVLMQVSPGWLSEVITGKRGCTDGQKREIAEILHTSRKKLFG